MPLLRTITLWLHVASVITWFGGLVFYLAVADPVARASSLAAERLRAFRDLDQRFRHVIWGSVEFAVVSGVALLLITMFQAGTGMHLSPAYSRAFLAKLLLAFLVIGMQLYNHIKINPVKRRLADQALAGPGAAPGGLAEPAGFAALQSCTRRIYALELVVAAAIVLLGVHLRSVL